MRGFRRGLTNRVNYGEVCPVALADFERSIKPMGDAIPIGQLICMALRYRSDQKGYLQPALQSLENQSLFAPFWLIKKEVVFDRMSG